jgi:hypothetical protein
MPRRGRQVISFDKAERFLRDLAGPAVCDNTVRKVCDGHGPRSRAWQRDDPETVRTFRDASSAESVGEGNSLQATFPRFFSGIRLCQRLSFLDPY